MIADAIVRWTARVFVACYVGRICFDVAGCSDTASQKRARWLWSVGCLLFVLHFAASMHFVHDWKHSAAYEHVLQRTREATGYATGLGIYANYAFGVMWIMDSIFWWRSLDWSKRPSCYWTVQAFFGFLIVQATVVFGPPFWIPISVAVALVLVLLRISARRIPAICKSGSQS